MTLAASTIASTADDPIDALLQGRWIDPDGGGRQAVPMAAIAIERSLRGSEAERVSRLNLGKRLAVVTDRATHDAMGARLVRSLGSVATVDSLVLDASPHADLPTVERLRAATSGADALVAVGSGTINDLCKYAAALDGKPYVVFGTAPSMNGYTSTNAAITVDGHKKTLPATAARGVFLDLEVLAAAPARLIRAGIGDSICRPTAQADWLLSRFVRDTEYREAPFVLLAADEPGWMDAPEALLRGDLDAMRALARTLILSGLGMTLCHGSYPASQGEHLISHFIDMFAPPGRAAFLHGEQVAVATLAMARIQERMLQGPPPVLHATAMNEAGLMAAFGAGIGRSCWDDFTVKALTAADAAEATATLRARWPDIVDAITPVMVPSSRIASVLQRAGAPASATDIGIDDAFFTHALNHARYLRDRYTFLDLAGDGGGVARPSMH